MALNYIDEEHRMSELVARLAISPVRKAFLYEQRGYENLFYLLYMEK